jgi:hypothetical protein
MADIIEILVTAKCAHCGMRFPAEVRYFCSDWGRLHEGTTVVLSFCSRGCHDQYYVEGQCVVCMDEDDSR